MPKIPMTKEPAQYRWLYEHDGNAIYCRDHTGRHLQAIGVDPLTAEVFVKVLNKARKPGEVMGEG